MDGAAPETPAPMPRWVKAFVAVAVLILALFLALHLTGMSPRH